MLAVKLESDSAEVLPGVAHRRLEGLELLRHELLQSRLSRPDPLEGIASLEASRELWHPLHDVFRDSDFEDIVLQPRGCIQVVFEPRETARAYASAMMCLITADPTSGENFWEAMPKILGRFFRMASQPERGRGHSDSPADHRDHRVYL